MRLPAVGALLAAAAVVSGACGAGAGRPAVGGSTPDFRTATPEASNEATPVDALPNLEGVSSPWATMAALPVPAVPPFEDEQVASAAEVAPTSELPASPTSANAGSGGDPTIPWYVPAGWADAYRVCLADPARFDRTTWILTEDWPRAEAEYVADHEGGWDLCSFNTQGSGACGWFQILPCPPDGLTATGQVRAAYAKWLDGGRSFARHWFAFWP